MFENIFSKKQTRKHRKSNKIIATSIIADHREKNSLVIAELTEHGIQVNMKHLPVADFLIQKIAIERKTVSDFLNSMISKRLSRQLQELKQYEKQLLIIEGIEEHELYNDYPEGIHGNAIRGFLLNILFKYQVPIIFTKDYKDTAKFLIILAKKSKPNHKSIRAKKKARNKKEQKQFILEGFPGIGPSTAKKLLKKFKTIKNIINQPIEILQKELGKKSEAFFQLIGDNY